MNGNNRLYCRVGLWASTAVLAALIGCTTYVEAPPPSPVYVAPPPPVEVREVVIEIRTERDFYEPLNPYGHWVEMADYGRCWVPDRVDRDWRPYTNGHWRHTEAGWYSGTDGPWGWGTDHFGRWGWRPGVGRLWGRRTAWAPRVAS